MTRPNPTSVRRAGRARSQGGGRYCERPAEVLTDYPLPLLRARRPPDGASPSQHVRPPARWRLGAALRRATGPPRSRKLRRCPPPHRAGVCLGSGITTSTNRRSARSSPEPRASDDWTATGPPCACSSTRRILKSSASSASLLSCVAGPRGATRFVPKAVAGVSISSSTGCHAPTPSCCKRHGHRPALLLRRAVSAPPRSPPSSIATSQRISPTSRASVAPSVSPSNERSPTPTAKPPESFPSIWLADSSERRQTTGASFAGSTPRRRSNSSPSCTPWAKACSSEHRKRSRRREMCRTASGHS